MKQVSTNCILKTVRNATSALSVLLLLNVSGFAQNCNAHFTDGPDSTVINGIHFTPASNATGTKYYWIFGDGSSSSTNMDPTHSYPLPGVYWACLYVADTAVNGDVCTDSYCDSVHVTARSFPPLCNAQFQFYSLNNPDSVHFYPSSTGSTIKYSWAFGDGTTSDSPTPWHFFATPGRYDVCLTVSDSTSAGKCTSTWCDSVNVGANSIPCNANFTFIIDSNNTVSFLSNPNPVGTKFYWTFGDNTTSSTNPNPTHTYAQSGVYYVCLTVRDSGVCDAQWCDSVRAKGNMPPPPNCSAQFVHYPLTNNIDSVHFYPTGSNATNAHYYWSFGDGQTSDAFNPWHLYAPGNYSACLTVVDSAPNGGVCTNTWCDSVHVPGRPVCNAQFQFYSLNTNCDSVHFYSAPGSDASIKYSWNFGDGSGSDNPYPWHNYASPSTYYVCLTVSDSTQAGKCSDTWCDSVHVRGGGAPPPVCNAHFYHYSLNATSDSVHFYTNTGSSTTKYYWSFGDGGTSNHADPWHVYAPGNYSACLTVTDSTAGGTCTDTWCDSIHVIAPPPPVCNAHFRHYSIHNPDSIHFYPVNANTSSPTTKYSWNFGDGSTSDGIYPWHLYADTGTYTVCLTVTDSTAGGTCSDTWCDTVHVQLPPPPPPPVCNAHFNHYSANSSNTVIHFYPATNAPGTKYFWTFGDGDTSSSQYPTHSYSSNGTYYVCLAVTDTTNYGVCGSAWCDSVHVGIERIPCNAQFRWQYANTVNTVYFISAPNPPGTTYSWNFGDGNTSTATNALHHYANPGMYWVCLTVNDSIGNCNATWCDSVHIGGGVPPICDPNFYFRPGNTVHSLYFFSAPNTPSTTYLWTFGDGDSSTAPNPFHQYAAPGTYKVCLEVSDTVAGCTDTRCLTIGPLRMAEGGSTTDGQNSNAIASVYPNPMNENAVLHIENASGVVTFRMYDNLGRLVNMITNLTNGDFDLSKQGLGAGIYLYQVIDGDNNVTRGKLIIQ